MGLCGVSSVRQVERGLVEYPESSGDGVVGNLERLAALHRQGYLTLGEFETQKARLLALG